MRTAGRGSSGARGRTGSRTARRVLSASPTRVHRRSHGVFRLIGTGPSRTVGPMARHQWDHAQLVAGVREGDRRALARAISLVENGDPRARDLVRELYPGTGRAYAIGVTGPPGVGKSSLIAALIGHAAWTRSERRRRLGRPVEPVLPGCPARRSDPALRSLPRPGGLHPLDGHERASRRARGGDAPGAAPARRGRQGHRVFGNRRRRPERGRGDQDRRHRAARADARVGRLRAGAEGGDHGDSRRDRGQQDGSPGCEDDADRSAVGARARSRE